MQAEQIDHPPHPPVLTPGKLHLVVFTVAARDFALLLEAVERVLPAMEITALPSAPSVVLGIVNIHARLIPVLDIRRRLGLPDKELSIEDHLIVARSAVRTVAVRVDTVSGVVESSLTNHKESGEIFPGIEYIAGAAALEGKIVLIHDLDRFFTVEEELLLAEAMETNESGI